MTENGAMPTSCGVKVKLLSNFRKSFALFLFLKIPYPKGFRLAQS